MQPDIEGIVAYQQKENDMANRGRPKGTKYPDGPYLDRMADMLLHKQVKTPNAAIMKIAQQDGMREKKGITAFRRRLHEKWSAQAEDCIKAARERHKELHPPARRVVDRRSAIQRQQNAIGSTLQAIENSPALQLQRMYEDLPHVKLQKMYEDLPNVRMQKLIDDMPTVRVQRLLEDSPAMRVQKMLSDHPAFKTFS